MENLSLKKREIHKKNQSKPILRDKINSKTILSSLIIILISAFLGQGSLFTTLYPFGFGMIIASSGIYSVAAFIGTSIGLLFSQTGIYFFRYFVCALTLLIIRIKFLSSKSKTGEIWFVPMFICFIVCVFTGVAVVIPTKGGFEEISVFVAEAIVASLSSFFYKKSYTYIMKAEENFLGSKEKACLYISFSTIVASLANIEIYSFSPAQLISFFAIISMSYMFCEAGGSVCAFACATALSSAYVNGYNILPLVFAGIVSGVFSPLGKISSAFSFVLIYSATSLFTQSENIFENIILSIVAATIFLLIPGKFYRKVSLAFKKNNIAYQENTYRKDISRKLSSTAETINGICCGMNKVSDNLKKIDNNSDHNIFCRVKEDVCADCKGYDKCWNQSFQYTIRGFEDLSKNYHEEKPFTATPFSKLFLEKCLKNEDLKNSLSCNFKRYDTLLNEEIRLDEKRNIMSDQMKYMSDILNDFSKDFNKCSLVDNELSQKIKDLFNSFSIRCTKALCIINTDSNMTIKIYCKEIDKEIDRKTIKSQIEKITLRKFSDPDIDFTQNGTVIIYKQRPWLKMKVGKIQLSSEEASICGDCLREISDDFGNRTIILSDGMGTGGRAAIDASMTAEYFGNLIENNISFDNALKLVNSVLSVKSTNESLSTIDAVRFNLFSGKVEFYKAGAAVSFVRKNGKCSLIESASLPVGILSDISFAKEKAMLSKGDIVVIVSDGVTNHSTDWIINEIENFNHSNPDVLAQKIAGTVCDKSRGKHRDDITVFVGIMTS